MWMSWIPWFYFLERGCIGVHWMKDLPSRAADVLITGICVDLAQKNCFLSFAVSCAANHSTEFFSLLFQKTSDNLLLHSFWSHTSAKKKKDPKRRMRQLRGKPKKETSKDKKERKQAMQEARQQITTVVLPTLAVVVLLIVVFVYVATRPNTTEWCSFSDSLALGYSFYQEPKGTLCHSFSTLQRILLVFSVFLLARVPWILFRNVT